MAELNKSVLGKVRGSLGELTFRQRNGKNIIATKPASFTPGSDPESVARRERFKLTIQLAKALNNVNYVKSAWNLVKPTEMTAFNYIFKTNYKNVSANEIVSNPMIFPGYGFNVENATSTFNTDSIDISIDPLGTAKGIDESVEINMFLVNILFMRNPINSNYEINMLSTIESNILPMDLVNALSFSVAIPDSLLTFFSDYQEKKVFSSLVTVDVSNNVVNFSNSFSS
jgi:hypothetical protein